MPPKVRAVWRGGASRPWGPRPSLGPETTRANPGTQDDLAVPFLASLERIERIRQRVRSQGQARASLLKGRPGRHADGRGIHGRRGRANGTYPECPLRPLPANADQGREILLLAVRQPVEEIAGR